MKVEVRKYDNPDDVIMKLTTDEVPPVGEEVVLNDNRYVVKKREWTYDNLPVPGREVFGMRSPSKATVILYVYHME